jgi:3-polyprenyl-4-hydroxybenzoate decarboxylase
MNPSMQHLIEELRAQDRIVDVRASVEAMSELKAVAVQIAGATRKLPVFSNIVGATDWQAVGDGHISRELWATALDASTDGLVPALLKRMRSKGPASIFIEPALAPVMEASEPFAAGSIPVPRRGSDDPAPVGTAILAVSTKGQMQLCLVDVLFDEDRISILDLPQNISTVDAVSVRCALFFGGGYAAYLAAELGRSEAAGYDLVASLGTEPVRLTEVDGLPVPADAECCLVGDMKSAASEIGPVSNDVGTYSRQSARMFRCASFHRRSKPVLPLVDRGVGPTLLATELQIWRQIENIEGGLDVLDICCDASAHGLVAAIKLRPRLMGQAKTALLGAISGGATRVKCAFAVDEDVDAERVLDVLWSVASRTEAGRDLDILEGLAMVASDPSADKMAGGAIAAKWFVDSTMPPLSQPTARAEYERAIPKNLTHTHLIDFEDI